MVSTIPAGLSIPDKGAFPHQKQDRYCSAGVFLNIALFSVASKRPTSSSSTYITEEETKGLGLRLKNEWVSVTQMPIVQSER